MTRAKLAIVIHAEEEFDWDSGFYRANTGVTHSKELIAFVEHIRQLKGKVTLAMDYPFASSIEGQNVIQHYRSESGRSIEFATHLHPWVNPPYENEKDHVSNQDSYPGNLPADMEKEKLNLLTQLIESECGKKPTTYLAGRYGIGDNTQSILKTLGYTVDLSISAYCDFSHQQGPDFSRYSNRMFVENGIAYLPHTSSILSLFPLVTKYFNQNPRIYNQLMKNKIGRLFGRVLRIRRYRLSPEGFTFKQMKAVTKSQLAVGQSEFILSFHSPTVKPGLTPYTHSLNDTDRFQSTVTEYLQWFLGEVGGECILPAQYTQSKKVNKDKK